MPADHNIEIGTGEGGIYRIRNQTNGNRYIGSAVNLQRRWAVHLANLRHDHHGNAHLQAAFVKYGEDAFVFSVLEYVQEPSKLIEREQHYLDTLNPEYNISPTAGSSLGILRTPEMRMKLSKAQTGNRNGFYGKRHSEGARAKMSAAKRGERHPNFGKHLSVETRAKMSLAAMGRSPSVETRRKISLAMAGRQLSEEHRRKIGEALKGRQLGTETLAKMSEARRAYWRRIHIAKSQEA